MLVKMKCEGAKISKNLLTSTKLTTHPTFVNV